MELKQYKPKSQQERRFITTAKSMLAKDGYALISFWGIENICGIMYADFFAKDAHGYVRIYFFLINGKHTYATTHHYGSVARLAEAFPNEQIFSAL